MRKYLCAYAFVILVVGGSFGSSAFAADDNSLVRFKGGIGVHPVSNIAGTPVVVGTTTTFPEVTRNVVRGVNPAGQIWVISDLKADVTVDGQIQVRGKGLLLGGGNNIGLNANASVFATLICEAAAPFVLHNSTVTGVPLAPNGDFRINDILTPTPPTTCDSPVLLIRNVNGQTWFAAGIQDLDTDDD